MYLSSFKTLPVSIVVRIPLYMIADLSGENEGGTSRQENCSGLHAFKVRHKMSCVLDVLDEFSGCNQLTPQIPHLAPTYHQARASEICDFELRVMAPTFL